MEKNEMLSKWDGIHLGVFSTHTQLHKNTGPQNLECRGAELLMLLILNKNFNTMYLFTMLATDNEQWLF